MTAKDEIEDVLKAIAICKSGKTRALLIWHLIEESKTESWQAFLMDIQHDLACVAERVLLRKWCEAAGMKYVLTHTPKGSYIEFRQHKMLYFSEQKSDLMVDSVLAGMKGRIF